MQALKLIFLWFILSFSFVLPYPDTYFARHSPAISAMILLNKFIRNTSLYVRQRLSTVIKIKFGFPGARVLSYEEGVYSYSPKHSMRKTYTRYIIASKWKDFYYGPRRLNITLIVDYNIVKHLQVRYSDKTCGKYYSIYFYDDLPEIIRNSIDYFIHVQYKLDYEMRNKIKPAINENPDKGLAGCLSRLYKNILSGVSCARLF